MFVRMRLAPIRAEFGEKWRKMVGKKVKNPALIIRHDRKKYPKNREPILDSLSGLKSLS